VLKKSANMLIYGESWGQWQKQQGGWVGRHPP
jgi:hypothetical protein